MQGAAWHALIHEIEGGGIACWYGLGSTSLNSVLKLSFGVKRTLKMRERKMHD